MTRYRLGCGVRKLLGIAVLCFGISACSSLPAELAVTDENTVIKDYQTFSSQDEASRQYVRLGGVIATVKNLSNRTRLEMVNLPIGSDGKPDIRQEPQGRYIVYIDGFLDPVTYAQGRLMTVLGNPLAPEKSQVGEFSADFPVLSVSAYHLWRVTERVVIHEPGSFLRDCNHWRCRDSFGSKTGQVIPEVK